MVVIVIISVLLLYTTLSIRTSSPQDRINTEARRLQRLVQLALDESVLRGQEYGIRFLEDGYYFLRYEEEQWTAMLGDKILHTRKLDEDISMELSVESVNVVIGDDSSDEDSDEKKEKPQIFLLSSGEITPQFSTRFYVHGYDESFEVKGNLDGSLELVAPE